MTIHGLTGRVFTTRYHKVNFSTQYNKYRWGRDLFVFTPRVYGLSHVVTENTLAFVNILLLLVRGSGTRIIGEHGGDASYTRGSFHLTSYNTLVFVTTLTSKGTTIGRNGPPTMPFVGCQGRLQHRQGFKRGGGGVLVPNGNFVGGTWVSLHFSTTNCTRGGPYSTTTVGRFTVGVGYHVLFL